jgi:hypothetical protein
VLQQDASSDLPVCVLEVDIQTSSDTIVLTYADPSTYGAAVFEQLEAFILADRYESIVDTIV